MADMKSNLPAQAPDWTQGVKHLRKVDPVLRKVIDRVGPCTLVSRGEPYIALCQAIFSQQVSTAAAATMFGRFKKLFPGGKPTPGRVLKRFLADEQSLIGCGLSRQKRGYVLDLSQRFDRKEIPIKKFPEMSDEEVIEALTLVKGVGRWTAEMFLMFVMCRPDLLPVDDLGVRRGMQVFYGMKELPTKEEAVALGEKWRPWRSVATWYLWRGQGETEVMKKKKMKGN
jgi:DNA-3-methyladenine glycosylase II